MYCLFCSTQCSLYSHKANELNLQLGVVVGGGINSQVTARLASRCEAVFSVYSRNNPEEKQGHLLFAF